MLPQSESHHFQQALTQLRTHQARLVGRNVRMIEGARPRDRIKRMRQLMQRTKVNRDKEEQLERALHQAIINEQLSNNEQRTSTNGQ